MHIPDGFIDTKTAIATATLSVIGISLALKNVKKTFPHAKIPLIGLAAAFIFAAQMLNFPVAGGTSGHLIGAVLASILIGPSAAILALSSVLILQCFLFADGGVTALGANIFLMGITATLSGYGIYQLLTITLGQSLRAKLVATSLAAWSSTVLTAMVCAGQLAFSQTVSFGIALPAMANVHMLIGLGEAFVTTLVIATLTKLRPELITNEICVERKLNYKEISLYGLLVSLGLALFVAPFACSWPDGLEKVAHVLGFENYAAENLLPALLPDYAVPGLRSSIVSTAIAGIVGTLIVFGLAYFLARFLTPQKIKS